MKSNMLAAAGFALVIALCAQDALKSPPMGASGDGTAPVRIVDRGFVVAPPLPEPNSAGEPRRVVFAVVLENPNADVSAEGLTVDATVFHPSGYRIAGDLMSVAQLLPAERRNIVGSALVPAEVADDAALSGRLSVSVSGPVRWRRVLDVPQPAVHLRPSAGRDGTPGVPGLATTSFSFIIDGRVTDGEISYAAAVISNPLDAFVVAMEIAVIAFNDQGQVVGGGRELVALAPFESVFAGVFLTIDPTNTRITRLEATAALPYIDLAPYER